MRLLATKYNPKPSIETAIAGNIKLVSEAPVAARAIGTFAELALLLPGDVVGGGLVATSH